MKIKETKKVRFYDLKSGETFRTHGDIIMKISATAGRKNGVRIRDGALSLYGELEIVSPVHGEFVEVIPHE